MTKMISMEECELIGEGVENKIFTSIVNTLNARHHSTNGISYFDQLSIDLSLAREGMRISFPEIHEEICLIMHKEYRSLDELSQHCLFLYLFTNEKDENEIVDSLLWHLEEWMEDRASDFLSKAKTDPEIIN